MPTHTDAKAMARTLRGALADRNVSLSHSECLEIVARQFGFADWNTLSAKLPVEEGRRARSQRPDAAPPPTVPMGTPSAVTEYVPAIPLRDIVIYPQGEGACQMTRDAAPEQVCCSFCGKSQHEVRSLVEGDCSRPRRAPERCVFICDECVTLCAQVNADMGACAPGNALPPRQERDDSTF
jgi:hypothetical protein